VAGVEINGTLMWFDKLRNAKRWSAFVQAVRTGSLPGRLSGRRKKKRSGKLRK
jgi:hypothetical protein